MHVCGRGGNGFTQLSSLTKELCALTNPQSSTSPLSCASMHSPPPPCPCPTHQPTRQHLTPEFYLRWGCVSKPHTSEISLAWTHSDSLGEGLAEQWPGAACHRKCSWDDAVAEVQRLWQITTHSWCQVSLHSGVFVPVPANVAAPGSTGTFACGETIWPLPNILQVEELLLPMWQTPQTPLPAPGDLSYFLTRTLPGPELWNFRLWAPLFIECSWY